MTFLATFVTFGASSSAVTEPTSTSICVGTVTGEVPRFLAAIAGLLFCWLGTITAHVTLTTTVVAFGGPFLWAITSLMPCLPAGVASSTSAITIVHLG